MKTPLIIHYTLWVLLPLTLSGCGLSEVKAWDRDLLAEEKMQLVPDPIDNYIDEHIYFSKEASQGGQGVGGGGCGCN
jgi:hypothetical protein